MCVVKYSTFILSRLSLTTNYNVIIIFGITDINAIHMPLSWKVSSSKMLRSVLQTMARHKQLCNWSINIEGV